jgi:phage terminase large subunit
MNRREHEFRVRWYQRRFHEALVNRTHDRLMAVWHRRAGKDEVVLNAMRHLAWNDPGTYWHCFPEQKQARKAIWNGVNGHTGRRRILEAFPEVIIKRMQDDDMFIELTNGATFQLIGSDRYDSTVGSGPKGIAYSEWALSNPAAWAYHSPMIRETKGFAAFITTPRGRNHAKTMIDRALKSDDWFGEILTVEDTGALTPSELVEALAEYVDLHGEDLGRALYEQEYLCSFNAAILGAFYGREMALVRSEGRIRAFEPFPGIPVHRAWDIGVKDDTSIWWFQVVNGALLIIDCYSASGAGVEHYAEIVHGKPYADGTDFVPHDAKVKEWGSGRTRIEAMQACGLKPKLVTLAGKLDGINAARLTLKRCIFHERCEDLGIAALEQYRREWDDEKKTFKANEVHDWTSHLADAFRYLSLAWREAPTKEEPKPPVFEWQGTPQGTIQSSQTIRQMIDAKRVRRERESD